MAGCRRFTRHAMLRLRERGIPENLVDMVLDSFDRLYYDVVRRRLVYAGWAAGDRRLLVVAEEEGGCLTIVTVVETRGFKVEERRVASGRWVCLHGC